MNNLELAQVYEKAADIIVQKGKARGVYHNEEGAVCAVGALAAAAKGNPNKAIDFLSEGVRYENIDPLARELRDSHPYGYGTSAKVFVWNDDVLTTAYDVAIMFKKVAKKLRTK